MCGVYRVFSNVSACAWFSIYDFSVKSPEIISNNIKVQRTCRTTIYDERKTKKITHTHTHKTNKMDDGRMQCIQESIMDNVVYTQQHALLQNILASSTQTHTHKRIETIKSKREIPFAIIHSFFLQTKFIKIIGVNLINIPTQST